MTDIHSKSVRSYNMSKIRSKNTKPELIVRKFLFAMGYRFRIHDKTLPGKPDIVLKRNKTAIFVNGCFWHGHKRCKYFTVPKTRTRWWQNKINKNKSNDELSVKTLKKGGWKVIVIWECQLKSSKSIEVLNKLNFSLKQNYESVKN